MWGPLVYLYSQAKVVLRRVRFLSVSQDPSGQLSGKGLLPRYPRPPPQGMPIEVGQQETPLLRLRWLVSPPSPGRALSTSILQLCFSVAERSTSSYFSHLLS